MLAELAAGKSVALISDAGTPLISDPGYKLVREAIAAGHPVTSLPGPSAVLAALAAAGLATDAFLFAGFLPPKQKARRTRLAELKSVPATLVFFEAPSRLAESLADIAAVLGDREAAVARELTKLHEEVRRGIPAELAQWADSGAQRRDGDPGRPRACGGRHGRDDRRQAPAAARAHKPQRRGQTGRPRAQDTPQSRLRPRPRFEARRRALSRRHRWRSLPAACLSFSPKS